MIALLWFHACRRDNPALFVTVLRDGLCPPGPAIKTGTKQLELGLGILPPRVYAYLGRTLDAFGHYALAFRNDAALPPGEVSPFDTGGLVSHLQPVSSWSNDLRQEYLRAFSWPSASLESVLRVYPGVGKVVSAQYLDVNRRPSWPGPHVPFGRDPPADIWAGASDWRAWTWEGRWAGIVPVRAALVGWSCPAAEYPMILDFADRAHNPDEIAWYQELLGKYVAGGLGGLVATLKSQQVST